MRSHKVFKPHMKPIEKILESSGTKRIEIRRVLMKFTKEHMLGFKLETKETIPKDGEEYFNMDEVRLEALNYQFEVDKNFDKRPWLGHQLNREVAPILKELGDRYVPTFDLRWDSKVEGIDKDLSESVPLQKQEHVIHAAKARQAAAKAK